MPRRYLSKFLPILITFSILLSACQMNMDPTLRPGTYSAPLPGGEFTFFVDLSGMQIPYFKIKAACEGQTFDQVIAGVKESFSIDNAGEFVIKTGDGYTFSGSFAKDGVTASGTYDLKGYCTGAWQAAQTAKAPETVAVVNGTKISGEEFITRTKYKRYLLVSQYTRLSDLLNELKNSNDPSTPQTIEEQMQDIALFLGNRQDVGEQTLDDLIQEELIRQEAARQGILVNNDDVQNLINSSFQYYPDGYPTPQPGSTPMPTQPSIQKDIFDQKYKTMLDEVAVNTGLTETDIRNYYETQILTNRLAKVLFPELEQGEEQVYASHILVGDLETAQKVLRRLGAGESWNLMVTTYSQDQFTVDTNGELGWLGHGQMVAEFEEAAYSTPVGQVSKPVQTVFGYHIIYVQGKEIRPYTPDQLVTARNQKMAEWIASQKANGVNITEGWQQLTPFMPALPPQ